MSQPQGQENPATPAAQADPIATQVLAADDDVRCNLDYNGLLTDIRAV